MSSLVLGLCGGIDVHDLHLDYGDEMVDRSAPTDDIPESRVQSPSALRTLGSVKKLVEEEVLNARFTDKILGRKWFDNFLERHP